MFSVWLFVGRPFFWRECSICFHVCTGIYLKSFHHSAVPQYSLCSASALRVQGRRNSLFRERILYFPCVQNSAVWVPGQLELIKHALRRGGIEEIPSSLYYSSTIWKLRIEKEQRPGCLHMSQQVVKLSCVGSSSSTLHIRGRMT